MRLLCFSALVALRFTTQQQQQQRQKNSHRRHCSSSWCSLILHQSVDHLHCVWRLTEHTPSTVVNREISKNPRMCYVYLLRWCFSFFTFSSYINRHRSHQPQQRQNGIQLENEQVLSDEYTLHIPSPIDLWFVSTEIKMQKSTICSFALCVVS